MIYLLQRPNSFGVNVRILTVFYCSFIQSIFLFSLSCWLNKLTIRVNNTRNCIMPNRGLCPYCGKVDMKVECIINQKEIKFYFLVLFSDASRLTVLYAPDKNKALFFFFFF